MINWLFLQKELLLVVCCKIKISGDLYLQPRETVLPRAPGCSVQMFTIPKEIDPDQQQGQQEYHHQFGQRQPHRSQDCHGMCLCWQVRNFKSFFVVLTSSFLLLLFQKSLV